MKLNPFIAVALLSVSSMIAACKGSKEPEQSFEYIPLSRFTIDSNAIAAGSAVQIIAYSGGKQSKKENINYFQFIVVNQGSGDTVRVLTALINVPGDSDKGIYTSPAMFDGGKGVFEATFEPKDSSQNMMINLYAMAGEKDNDLQAMEEVIADSGAAVSGNELVAVNKSLPIFENTNYKTTIGMLRFSSRPW